MDTDKARNRVAEPAEEEIKKHGDPLKKQVEEAAGKKLQDDEKEQDAKKD